MYGTLDADDVVHQEFFSGRDRSGEDGVHVDPTRSVAIAKHVGSVDLAVTDGQGEAVVAELCQQFKKLLLLLDPHDALLHVTALELGHEDFSLASRQRPRLVLR